MDGQTATASTARASDGRRYPSYNTWEGMQQPAREPGDRIGMLLDLDQGSMTAWKHDG